MGTWDVNPWDNDGGADWFGDMFDSTGLASYVEDTLGRSVEDSHEEIRAAAALLVALGRTYVWPIDDIDRHLTLAADRLQEILSAKVYSENPEIETVIRAEIEELRSRVKPGASSTDDQSPGAARRWWEFWK